MSISDYSVKRDKFEPEDGDIGMSFPCCVCIHRHGSDKDEPCRTCDHNANTVPTDRGPYIPMMDETEVGYPSQEWLNLTNRANGIVNEGTRTDAPKQGDKE